MNEIAFLNNLIECKKYLEEWGLLSKACIEKMKKASSEKYSEEFKKLSRGEDYFPVYKCAIENDDFDFVLKDQSFFQFSYDVSSEKKCEILRFAFYPAVQEWSFEKFVFSYLELNEIPLEEYEECRELYEQFISEQEPLNKTPFRYDYDSSLYVNQTHSAAHIHFGNEENVRIPTNTQLRPTGFLKMVFEFYYYDLWKKRIANEDNNILVFSCDTELLDKSFFDERDQLIPHVAFVNRKK